MVKHIWNHLRGVKPACRRLIFSLLMVISIHYVGYGESADYKNLPIELILTGAENGEAEAQHTLGDRYYRDENFEKAFEWYKKAAEQGHAEAQYALGRMYDFGEGVQAYSFEAFEWYYKAARQGLVEAQKTIGWCFFKGHGTYQNYDKAYEWHEKAAKHLEVNNLQSLGEIYFLARKYKMAFEFYSKAAEKGLAIAQCYLGACIKMGMMEFHKIIEKPQNGIRKQQSRETEMLNIFSACCTRKA